MDGKRQHFGPEPLDSDVTDAQHPCADQHSTVSRGKGVLKFPQTSRNGLCLFIPLIYCVHKAPYRGKCGPALWGKGRCMEMGREPGT